MKVSFDITLEKVLVVFNEKTFFSKLSEPLAQEIKKMIEETSFIVEATSNEITYLWVNFKDRGFPSNCESSYHVCLGKLVDREIYISLTFYKIKNKIICLYEMSGNFAFGYACDEFFKKVFRKVEYKTDAMNFHNILSMINEAEKKSS